MLITTSLPVALQVKESPPNCPSGRFSHVLSSSRTNTAAHLP
jgi:hypothetical protein